MSDTLVPPPTPASAAPRVFLSYARGDDEPFVHRLYAELTAAGFTVWFDRKTLMSRGLTFHQEIKDAIRSEVDRIVLEAPLLQRDGTVVVTQKNGQVCFLKLLHGNRRTSLAEAEAFIAHS